jgi:hypothetical protein
MRESQAPTTTAQIPRTAESSDAEMQRILRAELESELAKIDRYQDTYLSQVFALKQEYHNRGLWMPEFDLGE